MKIPKILQNLIDDLESLPGIGPKTAERLAFYLLKNPKEFLLKFAKDLVNLKDGIKMCNTCYNVGEEEYCMVCNNNQRDKSLLCVVETPLDIIALEKTGFNGVYHVLHGVINPLAGIGPDEIFLNQLLERVKKNIADISEIIIATNTSLEGESTAMYIKESLKREIGDTLEKDIKITRIGRGLPIGADIEYADESTLNNALKGRVKY